MKKPFRICLILFGIALLFVAALYFLATSGGFQKWVLVRQLPEGSAVDSVRVTASAARVSGLLLVLEDGTRVRLERAEADYSLAAALFSKTVRVGSVSVSGLEVILGEAGPEHGAKESGGAAGPDELADMIYRATAGGGWRFDIAKIDLQGRLVDAADRRYTFRVDSDGITPEKESEIRVALELAGVTGETAGLAALDGDASIRLTQNRNGGFQHFEAKVAAQGQDASGAVLLDLRKDFSFDLDPEARSGSFAFSFVLDWPRPEVFAPQLARLGAVELDLEGAGRLSESTLTVDSLSATGGSGGGEVLKVALLQPLELGPDLTARGELLRVALQDLPLSWINPWLPQGTLLSGAPLRADLILEREADGVLLLRSPEALTLGPLSLLQNDEPVLRELSVGLKPRLRYRADGAVNIQVASLRVTAPAGTLLAGDVEGEMDTGTGSLGGRAELGGSLGAILAQPPAAGRTGLAAGNYALELELSRGTALTVTLRGALDGLRGSSAAAPAPPLRFTVRLNEGNDSVWQLDAKAGIGPDDKPATDFGVTGTLRPGGTPPGFALELQSKQVRVADVTALADAFKPETGRATTPSQGPADGSDGPPWAGVSGSFAAAVDTVVLDSGAVVKNLRAAGRISEPALAVDSFRADLGSGAAEGKGSLNFDRMLALPYRLAVAADASKIDAAYFRTEGKRFPVNGIFDATVRLEGAGRNIGEAVDALQGQIRVSGREGVVTAFELDRRGELGLVGAGVLGAALNRPGIAALAQAVPYFKDIRFNQFLLELDRGADQRVNLSALRILSDSLRIEGSGSVKAARLSNALQAPLDLTLALGAKGKLAGYLDRLNLLEPLVGEDGFRNWSRTLKIAGTLQDPDTSALEKILTRAATSAIEKPAPQPPQAGAEASPPESQQLNPQTQETRPLTKEEKRAKEIEQGIQLLESLF